MGKKKWKPNSSEESENYNSHYYEKYNAVYYKYDTKRLAKPVGIRQMPMKWKAFMKSKSENDLTRCESSSITPCVILDKREMSDHTQLNESDCAKINDNTSANQLNEQTISTLTLGSVLKSTKTKTKKKKRTKQENTIESKQNGDIHKNGLSDLQTWKKDMKRKKKQDNETLMSEPDRQNEMCKEVANTVTEELFDNTGKKPKKKKKKTEQRDLVEGMTENDDFTKHQHCEKQSGTQSGNTTRKKKKKKSGSIEAINVDEKHVTENKIKKRKSKLPYVSPEPKRKKLEIENSDVLHTDNDLKRNEKKKTQLCEVSHETPVIEVLGEKTEVEKEVKKKKKKKKTLLLEVSHGTPVIEGIGEKTEVEKKVKKKKKDKKVDNQDKEASVFIGHTGQWGGVTLGDNARTNKFLRLMGAKNANQATNSTHVSKFNKALNMEEAEKLNSALENQFIAAKEAIFTKGKGVGLGFEKPPGEGKKFHIDTTKSKSVKFDD